MNRNRRSTFASILFVSILFGACGDDSPGRQLGMDAGSSPDAGVDARVADRRTLDGGPFQCGDAYEQLDDLFFGASEPTLLSLQACSVDADCTWLRKFYSCPANDFYFPGDVPFAQTQVDAGQAYLDGLQGEVCDVLPGNCNHPAGTRISVTAALCIDRTCKMAYGALPDGGPLPDAGGRL